MTVWLVRIWTHKNADEKAHTLSRRSKNVKKRTKTYEKRILCKFTFTHSATLISYLLIKPRYLLIVICISVICLSDLSGHAVNILLRISTSFIEEKAKKGALFVTNMKLQPYRSINYRFSQLPKIFRLKRP